MHIGSLIHRNWDSKLVSLVADYRKQIKWQNENGTNDTGDKYHISFYEMVIDAETSYGICIPSLKKTDTLLGKLMTFRVDAHTVLSKHAPNCLLLSPPFFKKKTEATCGEGKGATILHRNYRASRGK